MAAKVLGYEETVIKPKPLVEISGRPILWHIMKYYSFFGVNRFILALGYKGQKIKEYFYNYKVTSPDFYTKIGIKNQSEYLVSHSKKIGKLFLLIRVKIL